MVKTPEQFTDLNREAADTASRLAALTLENAEKLIRLQLETMHGVLEDSLRHAQALAQVKDSRQYVEQRAKAFEQGMERMMAYSGRIYDLAAATQSQLGKLMEARLAALAHGMTQIADEAAKSAPAGSTPALEAFRQTLAATNALVETMSRTAKQLAQAADANIKSAADTVKAGTKRRR
jgi:phasin family protein